jgi:alpha-L-arabinofuranosidase
MPRRQYSFLLVIGVVLLAGCLLFTGSAQTPSGRPDVFAVQVDRPGAAISPEMFGVFFEDINFAADGGLYPERVKNRSFEFTEPLNAWRKVEREGAEGELIVRTESPLNESNPHYLRIRIHAPGAGFGIVNAGFRGMGVEEGAEYVLSAYVRGGRAAPKTLQAELTDEGGRQLSSAKLTSFGGQWKKYEATLRPSATSPRARLTVLANEPGEIDVDMISVYPKETWKNRPNGLRSDLVKLLADMKPGFIRFPGGCIVEGRRLELRYDWKKTVGDVSERRLIVNRWNDEFNHKLTPDYFQSFGLGFFEYFQLAEDIGASPLPIVNCGMACQFNSSETAALDKLDPFIQDAMDLIAFANGSMQSRWGRLRARMGHPAPFNLKRIGIGNEQWGPRYIERYKRFAAVLKKAHPEIALIASAGPSASGKQFEYLWSSLRDLKADIIDEHYYMAPKWFLSNAGRYDRYDRRGPKVFAGEYAAQTSGVARPDNRNNWEAALAEAAFITGLERNADVVTLASYAPLFAHVDAWQWTPNMIWFDNLRSFGTPNYYVQKLYSTNLGTHVLPVTMNGSTDNSQQELYSSASLDRKSGEVILKIVNAGKEVRAARVDFSGIASLKGSAKQIVLVSGDLKAENSLDQSMRIAPVEKIITAAGRSLQVKLEPYSMTVLRTAYLQ